MPAHVNAVLLVTQRQRWDTTRAHGNPLGLTPNLDRIASRYTLLQNAISAQPAPGPGMAALQTGLFATRSGVFCDGRPMVAEVPTLATRFATAGYETGFVGKWPLAGPDHKLRIPAGKRGGYAHWMAAGQMEDCSEAYATFLFDEQGKSARLPGYRVDATIDEGIRFIRRHHEAPFLLTLSLAEIGPQTSRDDFPAPDGYAEQYTGRWTPPDLAALPAHTGPALTGGTAYRHLGGYFGIARRIDEAYGRLVDALMSLDLFDHTVVLFTSTSGCHFRTRNAGYDSSGHEASVHVPAVISGPGFENRGPVPELVSTIDLAATVLDAAGLATADLDGRPLLPLLNDPASASWADDVYFQISGHDLSRGVRTRRWKYIATARDVNSQQEPTAFTYFDQALYDLQADPYELENLSGCPDLKPVAERMRERLCNHIERIDGKRPRIAEAELRRDLHRTIDETEVDA